MKLSKTKPSMKVCNKIPRHKTKLNHETKVPLKLRSKIKLIMKVINNQHITKQKRKIPHRLIIHNQLKTKLPKTRVTNNKNNMAKLLHKMKLKSNLIINQHKIKHIYEMKVQLIHKTKLMQKMKVQTKPLHKMKQIRKMKVPHKKPKPQLITKLIQNLKVLKQYKTKLLHNITVLQTIHNKLNKIQQIKKIKITHRLTSQISTTNTMKLIQPNYLIKHKN